ncbi:MAG: HAD domain-containing protein [bacterium]
MKVIFLDIDGVLCVIPTGFDEFGALFHKRFEDNLKWIIEETNAKIVISSTWRLAGLEEMKEMWKHRNLAGEVIDITPFGGMDNIRGDEIQVWSDNNNTENYVIIDDDTDMWESQLNNFVQTSNNSDHPDCVDIGYGLTRKCAEKAIKILNDER